MLTDINSASADQSTTHSASCTIPQAGAPSCEAESNPGSSPITPDIPYHVGNPIDVVSGNKYQRDIDYRAFNSGLALIRHYNSSLTDYDTGFGPGWRHTYQVFLTRPEAGKLNIVQSDGRLIEFSRFAGTNNPVVYEPRNQSDGVLVESDESVWYLPDGRTFRFSGSYLVEIDTGDHRGSLTLNYRQRRVDTVTDSKGGVLKFVYTGSDSSLPEYGSNNAIQPVGSVQAVVLPNGDIIHYQYGQNENLVLAKYPDGDSVSYGYEDSGWLNHLTQRKSSLEGRTSDWRYDADGLAISWAEGDNQNGLQVNRSRNETSGAKSAQVIYADGRSENYQWMERQNEESPLTLDVDISCQNCPDYQSGKISSSADRELDIDNKTTKNSILTTETDPASFVWYSLERKAADNRQGGQDSFEGLLVDGEQSIPLRIKANRLGELTELEIADTSLSELAGKLLAGELETCKPGELDGTVDEITRRRFHALGHGYSPCAEDPMLMLHFADQMEQLSQGPNAGFRIQRRSTTGVRNWLERFQAGTLRYCGMPPGKTCDELADDLRMAELSRCAYGNHSCEPRFQLVDPNSVGLNPSRFSDGGFEAQLYFDPVENRHILSFRGTDGVGDDWTTNFAQARGEYARQYDLAFNLARDLDLFPTIQNLTFTGHSLGGGLATMAALATRGQASIFNSAAVQPQTAANYGLRNEYANSNTHINHVYTRSDPLTRFQGWADDLNYSLPSHISNTTIPADIQSVHGQNTQIPNPDIPWVNNRHENAPNAISGTWLVINHSIEAVVHTLENLASTNCPQQSTTP